MGALPSYCADCIAARRRAANKTLSGGRRVTDYGHPFDPGRWRLRSRRYPSHSAVPPVPPITTHAEVYARVVTFDGVTLRHRHNLRAKAPALVSR